MSLPTRENRPTYPVNRERVLLTLVKALLGEISPELRAVSIKWDSTTISIFFFFHEKISEKNYESAECVATEVISAFPEHKLQVTIEQIDYPEPFPQNIGEIIYWRREE